MADLFENPIGTDGFEFVEYTGPEPGKLAALFEQPRGHAQQDDPDRDEDVTDEAGGLRGFHTSGPLIFV